MWTHQYKFDMHWIHFINAGLKMPKSFSLPSGKLYQYFNRHFFDNRVNKIATYQHIKRWFIEHEYWIQTSGTINNPIIHKGLMNNYADCIHFGKCVKWQFHLTLPNNTHPFVITCIPHSPHTNNIHTPHTNNTHTPHTKNTHTPHTNNTHTHTHLTQTTPTHTSNKPKNVLLIWYPRILH